MSSPATDTSANPVPTLDALQLALERTRIAFDRTLMAAERTATSLITFGFAIYKFFQLDVERPRQNHLIGPREFALAMVVLGLLSLVIGIAEHQRGRRQLRRQYRELPWSGAMITAILVVALGVLALLVMIFRE